MAISITNAQAIQVANAVVDACDLGSANAAALLVIYSGTAPANVDTALAGNTVLAELDMSNPAFGPAAEVGDAARATAASIADDNDINATGTASFFRILDRDRTPRIQGAVTVTGGGGELELNAVSLVAGARLEVTSLTIDVNEI